MSEPEVEVRSPADAWEDVSDDVDALVESWGVAVGDRVSQGQPLGVLIVVKTTFDIVAPADGEVTAILVEAGSTCGRDAVLATLRRAAVA